MRGRSKNGIFVYLQLTLFCSAAAWILIIWSGHLNMGYGLVIPAIMWCPAFAALLTCRLLGRELSTLGWHWPQAKYLAAAYFVPLACVTGSDSRPLRRLRPGELRKCRNAILD
jgi:uncharacterized protein